MNRKHSSSFNSEGDLDSNSDSDNGLPQRSARELAGWVITNPRGHNCKLAVVCAPLKSDVKFAKRLMFILEDLTNSPFSEDSAFDPLRSSSLSGDTILLFVASERTCSTKVLESIQRPNVQLIVLLRSAICLNGGSLKASSIVPLHSKLRKEPTCETTLHISETLEYLFGQTEDACHLSLPRTKSSKRLGNDGMLCRSVYELEIRVLVLVSDRRFTDLLKAHEIASHIFYACGKVKSFLNAIERNPEAFTVLRENYEIARMVNRFANHRVKLASDWKVGRCKNGCLQYTDFDGKTTLFDPRLLPAESIFSTFGLSKQQNSDWIPQFVAHEREVRPSSLK